MTIEQVLYAIASAFRERHQYGIAKTRLLKLAYLAEVYYKRLTGQRLTETPWIFWHYGPYVMEYPTILESGAFIIENEREFDSIIPFPDWDAPKLQNDEEISISRALKLADEDFNELLDFVYFDTEPMMGAAQRGEVLDFDCVKPEQTYSVKNYVVSAKEQKVIRKKLDEIRTRRNAGR